MLPCAKFSTVLELCTILKLIPTRPNNAPAPMPRIAMNSSSSIAVAPLAGTAPAQQPARLYM
jgi:hypothetical protein